jgi:hypothetical protein
MRQWALLVVPSRALLPLLAAVITGILAMHAWAGGHSAGYGHPGAASSVVSVSQDVHPPAAYGGTAQHAFASASAVPQCDGSCGAESALASMCVVALLVAGALWLLERRRGLVPSSYRLDRVHQARARVTAPLRAPSLAELCISRT